MFNHPMLTLVDKIALARVMESGTHQPNLVDRAVVATVWELP